MPTLQDALRDATGHIRAFVEREAPLHDPHLDVMIHSINVIGSLTPVRSPNLGERSALAEYRRALEQLQPALHRLSARLLEARATIQEQSERLKVLRYYHRAPGI